MWRAAGQDEVVREEREGRNVFGVKHVEGRSKESE